IIGMMHVLLDSDLSEDQKKYSQIVYNSARALLTIVNDVLDLSKIEAGKLELDIREFDLEIAIKDIIALPELQARQKGIDFICSIAPDVPYLLQGDIGRIRQVINNLTGNAIKFTDQGQVTLNITLKSDENSFATLHFSVEDTGIGIKEETIRTLFQSFTQADMSITKKYGGTGLGLAISKLLVEKMNGTIGAESIEMIGSTFWFTLPLKKQEKKEEPYDFSIQNRKDLKVLVTTDGSDLGRNFGKHLDELKINYKCAMNETQAMVLLIQAAEENMPFQLVIMEAKESDTQAENLGREIKQDKTLKQTKLILLTSIGKQGDARRFEEIGFAAFLSKPVEKSLLSDCIKAVVARPSTETASTLPIITRYSIIETKKHFRRILIVEDMETNRLTARALIGKHGYKTDEAKNGLEAVEKHLANHYDLILMDCQMPVMDGFEATRRIREL
ncbi:MAG: ATP-binding protein, partial [Desulfobacula sp.]